MSSSSGGAFDLSAKKRAVLDALLREQGIERGKTERIRRRREDEGPAPLSFAQQRLWFFDQFEPGNPAYNLVSTVLLKGRLDVAALERSFNEVARRHEALRTTFDFKEGQPVQIIAAAQPLYLRVIDLTHVREAERDGRVQTLIKEEARQPFELRRGPLLRVILVRLGRDEHVLLLAMHHIVSDAWSMGVLIGEIVKLYEAFSSGRTVTLPELPIQYADFALWQREWLQGAVLEEQFQYWKRQLGGQLPVLELPADYPRPALQTYNGQILQFTLAPALTHSLKALGQTEGATLFMTLLAAFKVLLYRYTGQEDLTVGSPIANRHRQEIEPLIGFFVNTLAMRTDLSGNPTFRELLERVRETALGAYAHQDLPFEYLVEQLQPDRNLSHSPLVQVVFVLQNTPEQKIEMPGLTVTPLQGEVETAKFDLTLYIDDAGSELVGTFEYNTDLFNRSTIKRMAGHFQTLLSSIVANPTERINALSLLTEAERHQLLFDWNDTRTSYPLELCAHQLFEAQVERSPDAVALRFEDEQLSYRELNARANQVANYLEALGVGTGDITGIFMERSVEMIVGLLGLLKAGAACLPLDPSYPKERLAFMLKDAEASVVLSEQRLAENLADASARVICLDADWDAIAQRSDENRQRRAITPENWIYVIYTSGSTGKPKGVGMPHRALVNLVEWHRAQPKTSRRNLQFASLNFDVSFQEIFSTLSTGGQLLLIRESERIDIPALASFIERNGVERFHLPVVVLQKLAEEFCDKPQALYSLRELMVGGEQLQITAPIIKLFTELKDCVLYNHYGPSETHVVTSYLLPHEPSGWPALPPLGRPVANTEIYLLDSHLQPVPVGVPGELYIGGACLAHGYLKRTPLTAERFIPHPFSHSLGARFYKTGDLARYLEDGNIEFTGRNDFQVKIRGMRIELGEIEVALRQHESVREAVVTVRQDGTAVDKKLVAYIVAQREQSPTAKQLREFLKEKLPEYMLPASFVMLETFPLTSSGKLDRLALPAPEKNLEMEESYVAPRTAVEEVLAGIFAEVLAVERVGIHDNFFEAGGHSLLATQVASRVREAFQMELPLRKIFEEPTVAGLAEVLLEDEGERDRVERTAELLLRLSELSDEQVGSLVNQPEEAVSKKGTLSSGRFEEHAEEQVSIKEASRVGSVRPSHAERIKPRREGRRTAPLSFAQQRLWFLGQYAPEEILYNIPAALRLKGTLNIAALERSLNEILRRHEALRTTFAIRAERPVQFINEPSLWKLPVIDLREASLEEREREATRLAIEEAEKPFDLARGPLLRVKLVRLSADDQLLLVTMHHIISDGWSIKVFIQEIGALYEAYCEGLESPLSELPIQYADFAVWQREWLQGEVLEEQLHYWKQQLAGSTTALELPTDKPRPAFKTFRGADVSLTLPKKLSRELMQLSRREGATLFMTLLAGFSCLLSRYSGQADILIGTPIANRTRAETEELIGFFVNTLVLRTELSGNPSFRELLRRVREVCLSAYAHQDLPFEKLVEELQPERSLSHSPLFQVLFHLQNAVTERLQLSGLTMSQLEIETKTAKFDLSLAMAESAEGLIGRLNYNTDLFDAATIRRMAEHFQRLLEAVVENPDEQVSHLPLLTEDEKDRILIEWNETQRDYGKKPPIHEAFEEQAERTPQAIAVRFEQERLSYEDLNQRANQVGRYLQRLGVGPEVLVGLCMGRSIEMLVGLLGILKAGGAYVPLDPASPPERLSFIIKDAGLSVLLTREHLKESFPDCEAKLIFLDADWATIALESKENLERQVTTNNLAYIVYTSGSTGRPKGVLVEHNSLNNYVYGVRERLTLDSCGSFAMVQPLTVDSCVTAIYPPLLTGGCLHLITEERAADGQALADYFRRNRIDSLKIAPSHLAALHRTIEPHELMPRQRLVIGGEASRRDWGEKLQALAPCMVFNHYGPTETTVGVTTYHVNESVKEVRSVTLPIGRPLPNVQAYVLDDYMQPVPAGVAGDLYIGGKCVARGYLNRAELTATRFIPNPFSAEPGERLYRTGDVVRYLADGQIEFLGRQDEQVKVHGFRIEPGEIEAALREHESVEEAIVVALSDAHGETYLAAYVVARVGHTPASSELRAFLKGKLPEYMLPSVYLVLDKLPLSPHGKVDRRALPEPGGRGRELELPLIAPRNAVEEALAEIFEEILGIELVGIDDNFFALGGHSLLATMVVSRVRTAFKAELPLRRLFEAPTIRALAEFLITNESSPGEIEEKAALLQKIEDLSADDLEELLRIKRAKEAK
jgi:amino acid adenylation domain-containing protein